MFSHKDSLILAQTEQTGIDGVSKMFSDGGHMMRYTIDFSIGFFALLCVVALLRFLLKGN